MKISLMYHDVFINKPEESGLASDMYKIHYEQFEEQIRKIKDAEEKAPGNIVLTFDDGGVSFFMPIVQILDKYNLKGHFFLATKYINTPGFLTEEQIKEIDKRGHFIGSHSHTHPDDLSKLSDEEINNEWSLSISILEGIVGHKVVEASIPNGYQSKKIVEGARLANIDTLYTSKPTCNENDYKGMKIMGRYVVLKDMSSEDVMSLIINRKRRFLLSLKWYVLGIIKLILGDKYEGVKQKIFG